MSSRSGPPHGSQPVPAPFRAALDSLRPPRLSARIRLEEVPAPTRIAPYALALTGDIHNDTTELASGRFVVLYDPAGQDGWQGYFRVITLVRATMELDVGGDPLISDVGWTWIVEALAQTGAEHCAAGGTVTRVWSNSYGVLDERPATVDLEIRASWTALTPDLGPHLSAWGEVLTMMAGIPPVPDDVVILPVH